MGTLADNVVSVKGEGSIVEKDYLYLLNYLEEYMPLPKQLYATFEECMIPMAGMLSNSQFLTWVRQHPEVMEFLAMHLPPSTLPRTPLALLFKSEELLTSSYHPLNDSPPCRNDENNRSFSSFDFIGGEDSGEEDSDGFYDSDQLTEMEMSQSSFRGTSSPVPADDQVTSISTETSSVQNGTRERIKDTSDQREPCVDTMSTPVSVRNPTESRATAPVRGRSRGGSRSRGVQKMGRYMGKAVGGGISRVGHVGRSILHAGKSHGHNSHAADHMNGASTPPGCAFSSESQSTKKYVCGYLHKISDSKWGKKKSWHRRWFVLDRQRGVLSYYRHNPANHISSSSSHRNIVHMADSPVQRKAAAAVASNQFSESERRSSRSVMNSHDETKESTLTDPIATVSENVGKEQGLDPIPSQHQALLYLDESHPWYRGALDLNLESVSLLFEKALARNAPTRYFFQVSTLSLQDIDSKRGVQYKLCAETEAEFDLWTTAIAESINRKDAQSGKAKNRAPVVSHQQLYRQHLRQTKLETNAPDSNESNWNEAIDNLPSLPRSAEADNRREVVDNSIALPPRIVTQVSSKPDRKITRGSCWSLHVHLDGFQQCLILGLMLNIVTLGCLASEHVVSKLGVCIALSAMFAFSVYNPRQVHCPIRRSVGNNGEFNTTLEFGLLGTEEIQCRDPTNCCMHKAMKATDVSGETHEDRNVDRALRRFSSARVAKFPMGSTMTRCEMQANGRSSNLEHSWTTTRAETFAIRSLEYKKSRKKEPSQPALFEFLGADFVRTETKLDLISQRVDFPREHATSRLFIINFQFPSYGPSIWGDGANDGPGYTLALYWKIPDEIAEELQSPTTPTLKLLKRFFDDPSLTDRFKVIAQVTNQDECGITGLAKKLLLRHNATPVLTRPQHRIYHFQDGSTEVVVDVHAFSYVARRGIHALLDKTSRLVIDVAFVIQGETEDELPEQVLGCCRLDSVNVQKAKDLAS
ncbi:hypothetical protein PsorP6_017953 [Peronosclerospora sorghi]|uniref:Uncharacterized protein n=1 Tax=Peronosclerospora sorghi TaxID=230839 RepID=A0ACC0WC13_9STRA|nr:hypothetical protein PsorP6_017953 [Peronosclerospora sorghi]